jgi:hypothetical protein
VGGDHSDCKDRELHDRCGDPGDEGACAVHRRRKPIQRAGNHDDGDNDGERHHTRSFVTEFGDQDLLDGEEQDTDEQDCTLGDQPDLS